MLDFETSNSKLEIKFVENYFFLENYVTSEGAVSHNVLYHQSLPNTRYQVRFYVNNYFELLPIVSTAFNLTDLMIKLTQFVCFGSKCLSSVMFVAFFFFNQVFKQTTLVSVIDNLIGNILRIAL